MHLVRTRIPRWKCEKCGRSVKEEVFKDQVLRAVKMLPGKEMEIKRRIAEIKESKMERGIALRLEWQLKNLLPVASALSSSACYDEEDFRAKTAKDLSYWNDNALVRIVEKVVLEENTEFKGGIIIQLTEYSEPE